MKYENLFPTLSVDWLYIHSTKTKIIKVSPDSVLKIDFEIQKMDVFNGHMCLIVSEEDFEKIATAMQLAA